MQSGRIPGDLRHTKEASYDGTIREVRLVRDEVKEEKEMHDVRPQWPLEGLHFFFSVKWKAVE